MAKDTFYFSHDYNTRADEKIKLLLRKHGFLGYGVFWAIIEDLYNNANALRTDYEGIAFDLRVDTNIVKSVINDFDLFIIKDDFFGSLSVQRRLDERNEKSKKASNSAKCRWSKQKNDANAMRTQCERNAIKERKGKEIKEKKNKEIDLSFLQKDFIPIVEKWLLYKKEKKQEYKGQTSINTFCKKLIEYSNGDAIIAEAIIEQSIANNWAGIFELKNNNNGNKQQNGLDADAKWRAEMQASIARDYAALHE